MNKIHDSAIVALLAVVTTVFIMARVDSAFAHCDTLDGPVVADARIALATGEVTPVLKWVSSGEEENIKAAFQHTITVRMLGEDAKSLADMYFFETLVRIHRAGEGAPYSGLKRGSAVDPAVAMADEGIANKSVEKLSNILTEALRGKLEKQFSSVISSQKNADNSVDAGREYVEAYVKFTHFAESIHGLIKGGSEHDAHN